MLKIFFIVEGEKTVVEVAEGTTILEAAHANEIPLEGACEGALACSTCHVILSKEDYSKLPAPKEEEEDMLDMAFGLTPTSRLGCQIVLTKELDGLVLTIPTANRNN